MARGPRLGAAGLAQVAELTWQLRGRADRRQAEGARLGLAQNGGGKSGNDDAAMVVTILES
jgi:acetyl-CoA acyltransferase